MVSPMLNPALQFHNEGLCVIPCMPGDKNPSSEALGGKLVNGKWIGGEWKPYQGRCSTLEEVNHWWANGYKKDFNIGIVHGPVSGNYTTLDIDEDNGVTDLLYDNHPGLCTGRIEQSGSGQGYHIPIRVDALPDWGTDAKGEPIGNKTWKLYDGSIYLGKINIRATRCQTVAPPSIHPTGGLYRYMQTGPITRIKSFDSLIEWLNRVAPPKEKPARDYHKKAIRPNSGGDLISAIRAEFQTCLSVFAHFGMANQVKQERNDELRILGNGGLMLTADGERWFCFEDETGGGVFEAWWFARYGTPYDKHANFRQVLLEMAEAAGVDPAQFYRKGDEQKISIVNNGPKLWAGLYGQVWSKMR